MPGLGDLDVDTLLAPVAGAGAIGLAVSGGPDSLALLLVAAEWAKAEGRPRLFVYTVDHGLRPEAADEAAMVVAEATRLGIAARSLRWEGEKPETGIQAAARSARYGMIADAMALDGAEVLLTAHHLGDQAETVLMRLAHGSGIEGLRGMDAFARVGGLSIFRPFLAVDPAELAELVEGARLTPAHDPSNRDRHYERVRWRQLMPTLEDMGIETRRLGKFAERMGHAAQLITDSARAAWPALVEPGENGSYRLSQVGFADLNPLVGAKLLGLLLQKGAEDRRDPPLGAVESLAANLRRGGTLKAATLHGCEVASDGSSITIRRENPRRSPAGSRPAVTAN